MSRRIGKWVGAGGLLLFVLSCTALPDTGSRDGGSVTILDVPAPDLVPIEWGTLVAVIMSPAGDLSFLWFQDESGAIRSISYYHGTRQLSTQAALFRRR